MRRRIAALLQDHPDGLSPVQTRQLLNVLPTTEGHRDATDEPGVDGAAQVVGQCQFPIEAVSMTAGHGCPATASRIWGTPSSVTVPVSTDGSPSGGRRRCQSGENTRG